MKGRIGCVLIIAVGYLFWGGGQKLWTGARNWSPTVLSAADYAKTKPGGHWLQLTSCSLDIPSTLVREENRQVTELYIPVRPAGTAPGKIQVLFATKDTSLLLVEEQLKACKSKDEAADVLTRHREKLYNREIKGLVRYGIDLKDEDRKKLASLDNSLAPDFIIVDDGKEPSLLAGIGMLVGGIVLGGLTLAGYKKA